jgi:AcrR family transcriptional regulator
VAERGRAEDLDAAVLLGRSLHAAHIHRPGVDAPAVIDRDGLAGVPVERLAAARRVQAQQPGAAGVTPTVEDAAASASISRTTAYRYFPNKRALLVAAHPEIAATSMLPANPPRDPAARLDAVVRNFSAMILDT